MNAWKKLNSQRGESLTEVLVALLVGALAITMLAGAIVSSQQMIRHSGEVMDRYYQENNQLDAHSAPVTENIVLEMQQEKKDPATGNITYEDEGAPISVTGYIHHQGNDDIVAYAAG